MLFHNELNISHIISIDQINSSINCERLKYENYLHTDSVGKGVSTLSSTKLLVSYFSTISPFDNLLNKNTQCKEAGNINHHNLPLKQLIINAIIECIKVT